MGEKIRMEDGVEAGMGDTIFDYYSMKVGTIAEEPDSTGWFTVKHEGGTSALLNGERICSLATARHKGWVK